MSLFNIFWNYSERRLRGYVRIIVVSTLVFFAYFVASKSANHIKDDFIFTVVEELIACLLVCLIILGAWKFLDKRNLKNTLRKINSIWFKQLGVGILIGFILITVNFIVLFLFTDVKVSINYQGDSLIAFIGKILIRFIGFMAVAVNEELFSRGYLLTNFSEIIYNKKQNPNFSTYFGLIITSLLFGFLHYFNENATILSSVNLAFIGYLYGYAYVVTGSLALPIGLHFAWNFTQAQIFGLNVSGFPPMVSLIKTTYLSKIEISGGNFGPEGGIVILLSVIMGLFMIFMISYKNKSKKINNFANTKS